MELKISPYVLLIQFNSYTGAVVASTIQRKQIITGDDGEVLSEKLLQPEPLAVLNQGEGASLAGILDTTVIETVTNNSALNLQVVELQGQIDQGLTTITGLQGELTAEQGNSANLQTQLTTSSEQVTDLQAQLLTEQQHSADLQAQLDVIANQNVTLPVDG